MARLEEFLRIHFDKQKQGKKKHKKPQTSRSTKLLLKGSKTEGKFNLSSPTSLLAITEKSLTQQSFKYYFLLYTPSPYLLSREK